MTELIRTGDLDTRAEIHDLVIDFYREIVFDPELGPIFEEVAEVDWAAHIPKLIDFWARVLLGEPGYDGFVLAAHQHVHQLRAFRLEDFDRWFELFVESVDARWRGPYADAAKDHAARMAGTLARRILHETWPAVVQDEGGEAPCFAHLLDDADRPVAQSDGRMRR